MYAHVIWLSCLSKDNESTHLFHLLMNYVNYCRVSRNYPHTLKNYQSPAVSFNNTAQITSILICATRTQTLCIGLCLYAHSAHAKSIIFVVSAVWHTRPVVFILFVLWALKIRHTDLETTYNRGNRDNTKQHSNKKKVWVLFLFDYQASSPAKSGPSCETNKMSREGKVRERGRPRGLE